MNNNDMVDISVEVEALNLDGIEQNLLDYVEKKAKIDIDNSVESAEKSAEDASAAATEAAASAELASDCATQASESLGNYYTKTQTDNLLNAKQDILTFDSTPTSASTNPVTSGGVYTALSGKANTATTLAGYSITDGANTALSNLSSDGQMIVDSINSTISNCILEIPQLLKLELSGNVITHKTGSIQTQCGDIYATYTLTQDRSTTISDSLADGLYYASPSNNGTITITEQAKFGSGNTLPADGSVYERFFLTTDKKMYHYGAGNWGVSGLNYPVCIIEMKSGVASYAKDSNGNDMIFNGFSIVGHHVIAYPNNIKGLAPNGYDNGKLKNIERTSTSLTIQSIPIGYNSNYTLAIGATTTIQLFGNDVESISDLLTTSYLNQYVRNENKYYRYINNELSEFIGIKVAYIPSSSGSVDWNNIKIYQPYDSARDLLTDDLQNDITTITGYDATKTQTLKNVSGVLTWVDD